MVENEIERAWNLAIQQLQFGARVAIFLDDTMPIAWDGQVLTVAAKDPDAAEWLNDRIGRTIANELCGILNCLMNVYFVAADGGSDGSANAL
jgi:hypothetical protein